MKKLFLLIALPLMLICSSCGGSSSKGEISLDQTTMTTQEDTSFALTATVKGSEENVTWSSSDTSIAYVSSGTVFAKLVGECDITASITDAKASCHVIVTASEKGTYTIKTNSIFNTKIGEAYEVSTEVHYIEDGNDSVVNLAVTMESSDKRIFVVENGKINPLKRGTAYLLLTTSKCEKRVEVTVYDEFIETTDDFLQMLSDRTSIKGNGHSESKAYLLTKDLDFTGVDYSNFSTLLSSDDTETFNGIFEGNGHVISNITINCESGKHFSLFGNLNNAVIKDINFDNVKFVNTNVASGINGIAQYVTGINTVIKNVYLDVDFDTTTSSSSAKRNILLTTYNNSLTVADCPYAIEVSNIVINATFVSKNPSSIGFKTIDYGANTNFSNVYIYMNKVIASSIKGITVSNDLVGLVYTLNSGLLVGDQFTYSLVEVRLPKVKESAHTITDKVLTKVSEEITLDGYQNISDFPFAISSNGKGYGDYPSDKSQAVNELFSSWHAFGGDNSNPFIDLDLSNYSSLVFFVKCPDCKYITVKGINGEAISTIKYNPQCTDAWTEIEFNKTGSLWTLKFDGSTLASDYSYTNLNQFDFCFNEARYYISELFAK